MTIDTTKDFKKNTSSLVKAISLVGQILCETERIDCTTKCMGRNVICAYGKQKNFDWSYDGVYKTLRVTYTDGRSLPQNKPKLNSEFYVIWIEGFSPLRGEKLQSFSNDGCEYTTSMTQALRIRKEDIDKMKDKLKEKGIADWAINGAETFHQVNYAPKGTIYNF